MHGLSDASWECRSINDWRFVVLAFLAIVFVVEKITVTGKCMWNVGVRAGDSRDVFGQKRFFPFTPQNVLIGHSKFICQENNSTFSFRRDSHYIARYILQVHIQNGTWATCSTKRFQKSSRHILIKNLISMILGRRFWPHQRFCNFLSLCVRRHDVTIINFPVSFKLINDSKFDKFRYVLEYLIYHLHPFGGRREPGEPNQKRKDKIEAPWQALPPHFKNETKRNDWLQ